MATAPPVNVPNAVRGSVDASVPTCVSVNPMMVAAQAGGGNSTRSSGRRVGVGGASTRYSVEGAELAMFTALRAKSEQLTQTEVMAEQEHAVSASVCSRNKVIRQEFGRGVFSYFFFLQYVMVANVIFTLLSIVMFGVSLPVTPTVNSLVRAYTAYFPASLHSLWLGLTIAILGLSLLSGFMYQFAYKRRARAFIEEADGDAGASDMQTDLRTQMATHRERRRRRVITGFLFVAMILVQTAIMYAVFVAVKMTPPSMASLIVAIANNVLNFIARSVSRKLTDFELHRSSTNHRQSDMLKLYALKMVNIVVLYSLKELLTPTDVGSDVSGEDALVVCQSGRVCRCPLLTSAWTYFWLLITDTAFSCMVEPLIAWLIIRYRRVQAQRKEMSDYDVQRRFDVAEEYVGVLYRQFIILLGMPFFPLLTAVGCASYVIEWLVDRIKLIHFSRKELVRDEPLDMRVIVGCHIAVTLLAAFVFPSGFLFVSLRYNVQGCAFLA